MKEYRLGLHTNVWNAVRYALFTLALMPLAEMLWARIHSRRTFDRLVNGRRARLRRSALAHWGLHQEVDKKSKLSKVSAIVVCFLHIGGALLLEYGSGAEDAYIMKPSMLSRALSDDGGLREGGIYYFDAGYILGKPYGSTDCIDGEPRSLADFGLRVEEMHSKRLTVAYDDIPKPRIPDDRQATFFIPSTYHSIHMYDTGRARWYGIPGRSSTAFTGFINETITCRRLKPSSFECIEHKGKVDQADFFSEILAGHFVIGVSTPYWYWTRHEGSKMLKIILNRLSARINMAKSHPAESESWTAWVRRGMPLNQIPRVTNETIHLYLNIKEMRDGCEHKHAVPVSNLDESAILNVSEATFATHTFSPSTPSALLQGDRRFVLWVHGDGLSLWTITQRANEYCASHRLRTNLVTFHLCVMRSDSKIHEVAMYRKDWRHSTAEYNMVYNFSVRGTLRKADAQDLAVQALVESNRMDPLSGAVVFQRSQKRIARLIESGKVLTGLLRLIGNGKRGKSVLRKSDVATINILGMAGAAILMLLVVVPTTLMLVYYRQGAVADVETSYKRAVMQLDGFHSSRQVPRNAPDIFAKEGSDDILLISYTYKT